MAWDVAGDVGAGERVERTVTVQGIETHLFEAGPPDAPTLLYLHGTFLGNLWLDYHRTLARSFHLFAPDLPGFGLTERPDWMRDMDDYVLYLRDLLDALGLRQPFVAGRRARTAPDSGASAATSRSAGLPRRR